MKKLVTIISALLCLLMLASCGGEASTEASQEPAQETTQAPAPSAEPEQVEQEAQEPLVIGGGQEEAPASAPASLNEDDFVIVISGGELTFDMTMDSVFELLGTDYEYSEAVSCAYDGMDKTFSYADLDIYSWPDGETDRVSEIIIFSDLCTTARGITVGSTKDQVIAAYGQGTEVGTMLEYEGLGRMISFSFDGDAVADIDLLTILED